MVFDGVRDNVKIEAKTTQGMTVALSSAPGYLLETTETVKESVP